MYAIINTSGRQFKVEPGTVFAVDRLAGEPGEVVTLDGNVLLLKSDEDVKIGTPVVDGATVELEIIEHFRGPKLIVFKMKRRKRHRCKNGHRQEMTRVRVAGINAN